MTNRDLESYFNSELPFSDILSRLRSILLNCGLTEAQKWQAPCYTLEGKNICILGRFKDNCVLSFFKGAMLHDESGILLKAGENSQTGRIIRFRTLDDFTRVEPFLKAYIFEAIEIEKSGLKVTFNKSIDLILQYFNEEIALVQQLRYLGYYLYKQPSKKNLFFISNKNPVLFNNSLSSIDFDRYLLCKDPNKIQFFRKYGFGKQYPENTNETFCNNPTNEELDFAEKHVDTYEFEKYNLNKMRKIAKDCCDILKVQNYINDVRINLVNLLKTLYDDDYIREQYNEFTKKLELCDLKYLQKIDILDNNKELKSFNLRENMHIIVEIINSVFPIVYIYIINIKLNNIDISSFNLKLDLDNIAINTIIKNMKQLLGLGLNETRDDNIFKSLIEIDKCGNPNNKENNKNIMNMCIPSLQSLYRLSLTAIQNQYAALPIIKKSRIDRNNNRNR